jgi:hypothetical protein
MCDRAAPYRREDSDVGTAAQTVLIAGVYVGAIALLFWAVRRMK